MTQIHLKHPKNIKIIKITPIMTPWLQMVTCLITTPHSIDLKPNGHLAYYHNSRYSKRSDFHNPLKLSVLLLDQIVLKIFYHQHFKSHYVINHQDERERATKDKILSPFCVVTQGFIYFPSFLEILACEINDPQWNLSQDNVFYVPFCFRSIE